MAKQQTDQLLKKEHSIHIQPSIKLGLKENLPQFILLVIVNAFVGAMIGLERSILPEIGEKEFFLTAKTAVLSFIIVFGLTKAITNYFAGRWSDRYGRKKVLILGWLFTRFILTRKLH